MENKYDELNLINARSVPYELYFGKMDLTEEQKEKRIEFSKKMEEIIIFLLFLISAYREYNVEINIYKIKIEFINRFSLLIEEYVNGAKLNEMYTNEAINYFNAYKNEFIDSFLDTTIRNINDPFFLSKDRAVLISENEANTVINYIEFIKAIESGKKKKKWIDIKDNKERKTHAEVGGSIIPINEYFFVGDSMMLFPKDTSMGADLKEIANCRCSIKYF